MLKSGKDARGQAVIPEEEVKKHVGKGIGFSTLAVRAACLQAWLLPCVWRD